jgi:hypothetical protein
MALEDGGEIMDIDDPGVSYGMAFVNVDGDGDAYTVMVPTAALGVLEGWRVRVVAEGGGGCRR